MSRLTTCSTERRSSAASSSAWRASSALAVGGRSRFHLGAHPCLGLVDVLAAQPRHLLEGAPGVEAVAAGQRQPAGDHQPVEAPLAVRRPDEGEPGGGLLGRQVEHVAERRQLGFRHAGGRQPEAAGEGRLEQGVVGEGEGEVEGAVVAGGGGHRKLRPRPVVGRRRVTGEVEPPRPRGAGFGVVVEEGVSAAGERRLRRGAVAERHHVQGGAAGADGAREARGEMLGAGDGGLRHQRLAVADPQNTGLEAEAGQRVVAGVGAGRGGRADGEQHLHRPAGEQQARQRQQALARHLVGRDHRHHGGQQEQLVAREGLPVEPGQPGIVARRVVVPRHLEAGEPGCPQHPRHLLGLGVEADGGVDARVAAGRHPPAGDAGDPGAQLGEAAVVEHHQVGAVLRLRPTAAGTALERR